MNRRVAAKRRVSLGYWTGTLGRTTIDKIAERWLASTREHRKVLHKAAKRLVDETPMEWQALYNAAFPFPFAPGLGFEDNFRAGKIGRQKAMLIYRWMRTRHPEQADWVDSEIAGVSNTRLLPQSNARHDTVKFILVPAEPRDGVIQIALPKALLHEILKVIANGFIVDPAVVNATDGPARDPTAAPESNDGTRSSD